MYISNVCTYVRSGVILTTHDEIARILHRYGKYYPEIHHKHFEGENRSILSHTTVIREKSPIRTSADKIVAPRLKPDKKLITTKTSVLIFLCQNRPASYLATVPIITLPRVCPLELLQLRLLQQMLWPPTSLLPVLRHHFPTMYARFQKTRSTLLTPPAKA